MREILFRGKRLNNGEWADGYLYEHEPALVGIVSENDVPEPSKWFIARTGFADWNMPRPVEFVEVDPSTVGQYTGLTDKNGKRIFEGDILRYKNTDDEYGFMFVEFRDGSFRVNERGDICDPVSEVLCLGVEIIGNIHENPELLEED